jgi:hypothetical protein
MWDVHYQPLGAGGGGRGGGLPIAAVPYTVSPSSTPWVNPGTYTVKLTVNGKSYTQPITVMQDPRVKTPALVMQDVYAATEATYFGAVDAQEVARQAQGLRDQVAALLPQATDTTKQALEDFDKKVEALEGAGGAGAGGRGGRGGRGGGRSGAPDTAAAAPASLSSVAGTLSGLMNSLQAADVRRPRIRWPRSRARARRRRRRWRAGRRSRRSICPLNVKLKAAGLAPIG